MENYTDFIIDYSTINIEELNINKITQKWKPYIEKMGITSNKELQDVIALFVELANKNTDEITMVRFPDYIKDIIHIRCKNYTKQIEVRTFLDELTGDLIYKEVGNESHILNVGLGLSNINIIKIFGSDYYDFLLKNNFIIKNIISKTDIDIISFIRISNYVYINDTKYKCRDGSKCEKCDLTILNDCKLQHYCAETKTLKLSI